MVTALRHPPKVIRVVLREEAVRFQATGPVDRAAGVIRGVRFLGFESKNGRVYPPDVVIAALHLYEGCPVNIDHGKRAEETRSSTDRFGRLVNIRVEEGKPCADLEYLKAHPMAERICEAAERMQELFGLSHNCQAEAERDAGGTLVVRKIIEVRSVDIVTDPATTNGLLEERQPMQTTPTRAYLEALRPLARGDGVQLLTALLEMDGALPADMPLMDQDATAGVAPADRMAAAKSHVIAAVGELVQSDDPELHKLGMKLMKLLKPDGAGDEDAAVATTIADESRTPEVDPMLQQLQEQVAQLQADKAANELALWVREQCDARKLGTDKQLLEGVAAMRDRKLIAAHLDYLAKKFQERPAPTTKPPPRSQSPGRPLTESAGAVPEDVDAFVRAVV